MERDSSNISIFSAGKDCNIVSKTNRAMIVDKDVSVESPVASNLGEDNLFMNINALPSSSIKKSTKLSDRKLSSKTYVANIGRLY
jgi:hypothetical protein